MRFALGVDDDLRAFHDRFRRDPLIGPSVRRRPWLRVSRRPEPFEALAWAITEQLIDFPRAVEIQRRIVYRLGRRCSATGLRDLPDAATLAGTAPALLQSLDLSAGRSLALRKAAREVAAGRGTCCRSSARCPSSSTSTSSAAGIDGRSPARGPRRLAGSPAPPRGARRHPSRPRGRARATAPRRG